MNLLIVNVYIRPNIPAMKKPILSLPCSQRIEDLKNNRPGYHCSLCEKNISDFRSKTNDEILKTIQDAPGKVCGIFSPSQTEYNVAQVFLPKLKQTVGLSLMGILGFMGPALLSSCDSNSPDQQAVKLDAFKKLKFPMNLNGALFDKKTNKPIPHAFVELQQHGKTILKARSDENGNFTFLIQREDLRNEAFDLSFGAEGYATSNLEDFLLKGKNNPKRIRLTLQANPEQCITLRDYGYPAPGMMVVDGIEAPEVYPAPDVLGDVMMEPEVLPKDHPPHSTVQKPVKNSSASGKDSGKKPE